MVKSIIKMILLIRNHHYIIIVDVRLKLYDQSKQVMQRKTVTTVQIIGLNTLVSCLNIM